MKVDFNNAILPKLNFKAIGKDTSLPFSTEQNRVADKIAGLLSEPRDEFGGMTAENFYKQRYDLDFLISPGYSFRHNCVELLGTNFNRNKDGELTYKNSDNFRIGKYNIQNTQDDSRLLQDIKNAKKKADEQPLRINMWGYLVLVVVMYGSVLGPRIFRKPSNPKAIIENADTLIKKVDTIANDTIDFQKCVKQ